MGQGRHILRSMSDPVYPLKSIDNNNNNKFILLSVPS